MGEVKINITYFQIFFYKKNNSIIKLFETIFWKKEIYDKKIFSIKNKSILHEINK